MSRKRRDRAADPAAPGRVRVEHEADRLVLRAMGDWDLSAAGALDAALAGIAPQPGARAAEVDLSRLETLDTAGAWLLRRTCDAFAERGLAVAVTGADAVQQRLIDDVARADCSYPVRERAPPKLVELAEAVGRATFAARDEAVGLIGFLGLVLVRLGTVLRRPGRLRGRAVIHHMESTGLNAMPIVGLLSFLIGIVLAYQGAEQLRRFGAEIFVVNLLGLSVLREIGVLLTAIIVAGRSGSAFTAQIGTMKVNQEVDAMETLGLDPVELLVLPRLLALAVTLPLLGFYADLLGLFGGAVMAAIVLDISIPQFVQQLQSSVEVKHFWVGIIKAPVFAFTIAMVGCYQGLKATGSAQEVGRLTTESVVLSLFLIIVLDAAFSVFFSLIGLGP